MTARGYTVFLAVTVVLAAALPMSISAQEYGLFGSVETRGVAIYRKDSPVVVDATLRGTWYPTALARVAATHRLTLGGGDTPAELLVDHAVTAVPAGASSGDGNALTDAFGPAPGSEGPQTGTAGTGTATATAVLLGHEIYQAYVSVRAGDQVALRAGRQRLNWGTGWTFSVTDALHPQSPDSEVEPGFDGLSVSFHPSPNLSLEVALAVQDALATEDLNDLRQAAYISAYLAPVDLSLSLVHQYATMLRPGIGLSLPAGPLLIAGEAAVETYDPRGEVLNTQPLASIGAEYTWYGDLTDVVLLGEYIYNGLEETYPGPAAPSLIVTTDAAGGFQRPGRHYAALTAGLTSEESWSTEHSLLANLSDESYLVRHEATLLRIPAVDLSAGVTWNAGEAATEFGRLPQGMVVELGATAYF
ncbi:MAG: hypothetical protein ACOCYB_10850 [Alkalispirochaeta sp.]